MDIAMSKKVELPLNLFSAYNWVDAAGEIHILSSMNEDSAKQYCKDASENAHSHNIDITENDIYRLYHWLQSIK